MNRLLRVFISLDRRDRFVYGITATVMIVVASGSILDLHAGRLSQSLVQGLLVFIAAGLLLHYRYYNNRMFFVCCGITAASLGYDLLLYFDHFALYSYLIPLIMPLVFFFLLPLRGALMASMLHYIGLVALSEYAYHSLHISSALFQPNAIQTYILGAIFVIAIGLFYHVAVERTYRELAKANAQKELLLKEIHHRIKNNLNKMASALGLQIFRLQRGYHEEPESILRKNKLRIEAMALVHEALYRSDDLTNVGVDAYIRELIELIRQTYDYHQPVDVNAEGVSLPIEKILRLGTIINELYTNTVKHTREPKDVSVTITLHRHGHKHYLFTYAQEGSVDGISTEAIEKHHGLGMMLVELSAREMNGEMTMEVSTDGVKFKVLFS